MTGFERQDDHQWVPQACTLPTAERPLRLAEFDDLFAVALRGCDRTGPTLLRLFLDAPPQIEATARDLTVRESGCCSFFAFTFTRTPEHLLLDVAVPVEQAEVLDGLAARARAVLAVRS
ncbi:hypothetical protein [Micromonospora sp. NPDC003241]